LKPRTEPVESGKKSDLFGGGKAWEETDEIRKKMETIEVQDKKHREEIEKTHEEEKKRKQEEREKQKTEKFEKKDDKGEGRPQKKSMDFSSFGKSSDKKGTGNKPRTTGAIPTDETGKKDYKKRYENKEKKEDDTKKEPKKDTKAAPTGNSYGGFGVLGEEDLE